MKKSQINVIRWIARILGALLVLFVLLSAIGGIIDPPPQTTGNVTKQDIPLMIGMISMVVGIIVAWFREPIGGLLIIGGFIFFVIVELITSQNFDAWFLVIFPIVGLLHLFSWRQSRKLSSKES
jgi:uncharacterized membrane protein YkvI